MDVRFMSGENEHLSSVGEGQLLQKTGLPDRY